MRLQIAKRLLLKYVSEIYTRTNEHNAFVNPYVPCLFFFHALRLSDKLKFKASR